MMKCATLDRRWLWLGLAVASILLCTVVANAARPKTVKTDPAAQTVEMFSAVDAGQIDVTIIPRDSTRSRVLIKNKTDQPLVVKMPEAFAGVPVMAQFGGGIGGRGGGRGGRDRGFGGSQGFGGGFGGGMMGGMRGGMGGMFNIAPEKVGKIKVTTVCLEHGKSEPRPAIKYKMVPIGELTDRPEVHELCAMLGRGQITQRAAQAAAWHLNNNMSWEELAAKQLRFANGARRPYFSPQELRAAVQIAGEATRLAKQREEQTPGKDTSLSQY